MTQDNFNQLVTDSGLNPATLKRNGIAPGVKFARVARDELAARYEQEAAAKIRAARALRGVMPFDCQPAMLQTAIRLQLMTNWTWSGNNE